VVQLQQLHRREVEVVVCCGHALLKMYGVVLTRTACALGAQLNWLLHGLVLHVVSLLSCHACCLAAFTAEPCQVECFLLPLKAAGWVILPDGCQVGHELSPWIYFNV
jgi:hypothetical protein